jgi:hypothetical protein
LDIGVEVQRDVNGIEMGVLENGISRKPGWPSWLAGDYVLCEHKPLASQR